MLTRIPLEAWIWTTALVVLACTDPAADPLVELCPWRAVLDWRCPGCGLGHAVIYLFDGDWTLAWQTHPLALPAVLILAGRTATLVRHAFTAPLASAAS